MTEAREFWNKSADNYDKTEERFDVIHRRSRELAKGHLNETDLVLELAEMKAAAGDGPNVTFSQGDIFDKDLAPGFFDAILAFNMLHTVPDPESVMNSVHELLKPDGLLLSVTPCLGGKMSIGVRLQVLLVGVLGRIGVIPVPIRRLRSADLDSLIASVPLSVGRSGRGDLRKCLYLLRRGEEGSHRDDTVEQTPGFGSSASLARHRSASRPGNPDSPIAGKLIGSDSCRQIARRRDIDRPSDCRGKKRQVQASYKHA